MRQGAMSDGSVKVKISGCEYKVSGDRLKAALEHWGELTTDIKEEVFVDPHDNEGTNRTGVYVVQMKMNSELPEIIHILESFGNECGWCMNGYSLRSLVISQPNCE